MEEVGFNRMMAIVVRMTRVMALVIVVCECFWLVMAMVMMMIGHSQEEGRTVWANGHGCVVCERDRKRAPSKRETKEQRVWNNNSSCLYKVRCGLVVSVDVGDEMSIIVN